GHENFGDDLLFDIAASLVPPIKNADIFIVVVGNLDPSYLKQYIPNLQIIRFKKRIPLYFYWQFNKIFYIGGGVFFDYRKKLPFFSFLKNYALGFIRYRIARLFGAKFAGIGIGIGPYF